MKSSSPQIELFAPPLPSRKPASRAPTKPGLEQSLRELMMEVFLDEEPVQRLLQVTALVPSAHRGAWHLVTHTLLARRLREAAPMAPGRTVANAHTLAWSLSRQWQEPVLAQRWQRLISGLSSDQCRRLLTRARQHPQLH